MKTLKRLIRFILCWIYNIIYLPLASVINICSLRIFASHIVYLLARGWGLGVFFIFGIKIDIENRECLDELSPKILIFNHASTLDILVLASLFPKGGCAIGKKQIMFIPFINLAWWAMGYVFLDRKNREKSREQLAKIAKRMIDKKLTMLIAPEGTRSKTGELQPFKMGAFHVALDAKVPIHPMVIFNAKEIMPYEQIIPNSGLLRIKILDPISTKSWTHENLREKSEELWTLYAKELGELKENNP